MRSVLLCEDLQHERVFRPILERKFSRPPRVEHQGGFAYVLKRLPLEAEYVRQRAHEAVALVVVIDGDRKGIEKRLQEVQQAGNLTDNAWKQQIAICVPTRNVETWILWLCGDDDLDEATDYKQRVSGQPDGGIGSARQAAEAWFAHDSARREAEKARLPALTHGRGEINRVGRLAKG